MAGGMEWFRWHHGSTNDPKFGLIAKKAGSSVAEVIAVWASFLESASVSDQRGYVGEVDFESLDFGLGLDDGLSKRIHALMCERGLIDAETGFVSSWEKRQVKRERDGDNSTERSRAFRQRQRHATPKNNDATPCNTMQRQETPRGEERRREEINTSSSNPEGFDSFWQVYPKKVGKPAAEKAFKAAKLNGHLPEVLADIELKKESEAWTKNGGQFIPNPATYLNQRRWEDGLEIESSSIFAGAI